jgi:CRISPR-associated protein Csx10
MKALTYKIYLCQPVLITQPLTGEPNSSVTYDFIPGSAVRGGLIAASRADGIDVDARIEEIRHLFFDGSVCFLNAYLAHPLNKRRMLPNPLSWRLPKDLVDDPTAPVFDISVQPKGWDEPDKAPTGKYFWKGKENIQLGSPEIEVRVHNASDDRNRKLEGGSQVFRYEALASGQVFAGAVLSEDPKQLETIKTLLRKGSFHLGGAQSNAYGSVEIQDISDPVEWEEYTPDPEGSSLPTVTLTCLSDLILRGPHGQGRPDWNALLGIKQGPVASFYALRLVGGFDRTWGLPARQDWAIAAGSVFVLPASARSILTEWVKKSVGERRAEGFGRVAIDLNATASLTQTPLPEREAEFNLLDLSAESKNLACRLGKRQIQRAVDNYLAEKISEIINYPVAFSGLPRPAQLMRARLIARRAWETGNLSLITDHFDHLTDLTKRAWRSSRIGGRPMEAWIRDLIDKREEFSPVEPQIIAGEKVDLDDDLRDKTIARLIERVLKQAARAARRQ